MNGKKLFTALALSAILFTGCGLKSKEVIIKVNDTPITKGQFDELFKKQTQNSMFAKMGVKITKENNGFMYYLIQDRVVNELIIQTLLEQEMAKRKVELSEAELNKSIQLLMNQVGGKTELNKILKQHGISHKEFKQDLTKELRIKALAKQVDDTTVSDNDTKKYYNANIDKFKNPDKVRASHILIEANPQALTVQLKAKHKDITQEELNAKIEAKIKESEAKANELLAKVKANPEDFAKIAKENSQDKTTAVNGGDLGFFGAQEMVPEFSKAAFSMKPNTISEQPVKTQYGYHIIKVTDRMAASQQPYEKVKNSLKQYLENEKQVKAIDKLTESLKKQANIEFVNSEYDPKEIQKGIEQEVNEAPKKIEAAEKKSAEKRARRTKK